MYRPLLASLTSVLLLVGGAAARGEPAGALAGRVRTTEGTPVPQLLLVVAGPGGERTAVTGPEGGYRVAGLAPGEYRVRLEAPGFILSPEPRRVVGATEEGLDLVLSPAPVREQVLVAATRAEAAISSLGVAASVLDRERIAERRSPDVLHLLEEVPGATVARAGGLGRQGSLFLRGGPSNAARVMIDGVPVNEPGGAFDFGALLPLSLEQIEVVRGAASSLYGTDALAGVVHLVTRRAGPGDDTAFEAEAEGGRFDSRRLQGEALGRRGGLDWTAGALRVETDNQEPNSAFRETAGAAALGVRLGERSAVRLVARGGLSTAGTPGPTAFGRPDLDASIERHLLVVGGRFLRAGDGFSHEVRAGYALSDELDLNPLDSGSYVPRFGDRAGAFSISDFTDPAGFQNDTRRLSLGYQVDGRAAARHLLTAGIDLERETGALGTRAEPLLSPHRTNVGAYVQDRLVVGDRLFLTAGARVERNAGFGTRAVPRAAAAWRLRRGADATTLRASAGTGIKEPSFFQSFGVSFFAEGNPNLKAERSRTFDLGIEQRLLGGRLRGEATAFQHDYLDQVAYHVVDFTTFQGGYVNLGRTRARGVELSVEAAPAASIWLSAAYTFLDGTILVSTDEFDPVVAVGRPLLRRPKHQASFGGRFTRGRVGLGANLVAVGRRADSDFAGLGLLTNGGYVRLDVRARARLGHGLEAFAVGENLLDRRYQEVLGYPALGRVVRAGLHFQSGPSRP
ncbi:MAG TPA: TonB-dependent receptor [Vicinamibacteria bacterium]|nr:TonB-dependent receptor [Vicinamibacteria bacterium]